MIALEGHVIYFTYLLFFHVPITYVLIGSDFEYSEQFQS